ncbi:MAG TPA: XTP/dITP diphosphatase [Polyangiaceae bacterium]|nr:XTP/dITP diphosphatase [Polyangiaceae bacterium]
MSEPINIVLATTNAGKVRELAQLFASSPVRLMSVKDVLGAALDVDETGTTFEENARIKARAIARATQQLALADDSGLEVDALQGRPGVYSARYAGPGARDADNNEKLLRELAAVPSALRTARFRCVLALVEPVRFEEVISSGTCEGRITNAPRGQQGFGYDPLFEVARFPGLTLAELDAERKNSISHRASAARALLGAWSKLLAPRAV